MRLTLALLGHVLELYLGPEDDDTEPPPDGASLDGGTTSSYPIGFTPSHGDARWEPGADYGSGE